jgi:hypothetical protein
MSKMKAYHLTILGEPLEQGQRSLFLLHQPSYKDGTLINEPQLAPDNLFL